MGTRRLFRLVCVLAFFCSAAGFHRSQLAELYESSFFFFLDRDEGNHVFMTLIPPSLDAVWARRELYVIIKPRQRWKI